MELDKIDLSILRCLQENARLTNVQLSEQVNLSPSQCHRRIRKMEDEGLIQGYAAIIDLATAGLDVVALVNVTLEKHQGRAVTEFIKATKDHSEILECWTVPGDSDYLLRVVAPDLKAFSRFIMDVLTALPLVSTVKSRILLDELKAERKIPLEHLLKR